MNLNQIYEDDEVNDVISSTKKDECCYKFIAPTKSKNDNKPFEHVIGHENQKKELLNVINWFKNSKELTKKGLSIPKGVLLFGRPGNGKSLMIKETIKYCECPVFIFQGEQNDVVKGVYETFKKAKEVEHAIVIFDELDLLINKESRVVRALQENLDGVESSDDILVLAATNDLDEIPDALLRNGRLEKIIKIPNPKGKEAVDLFKKTYFSLNLKLPEDFDEEELELTLTGVSCVGIKSIVNDIALRNGFDNITTEMIYDSIYNITDLVKDSPKKDNLDVAIHEAGHALVAMSFPQYFQVNRLNISGASGEFLAKDLNVGFYPYDKVIADIKISMAGVLAQKIICGKGSLGCETDLDKVWASAYELFTQNGYSSCSDKLECAEICKPRVETFIKLRKIERKIEKLLKRCEKETSKYIKQHQNEIKKLGESLYKKKHLKSSEILSCIKECR